MLDMKFFYIYLKYYNFANYFGFEKLGDTVFDALKNRNISGANQPFHPNYENPCHTRISQFWCFQTLPTTSFCIM